MSSSNPATERDPRALARLLRARLDEGGLSIAEAARRTGLARATVHALLTREIAQAPKPSTLDALHHGLGIPTERLRDAVAEAVGYYVTDLSRELGDDPDLRLIVATAHELSPADRHALARMARGLLLEARREAQDTP